MSKAKLPVIILGIALVGWWGISKTRSLSAPQSLDQQAEAEATADALRAANAAKDARSPASAPVAGPKDQTSVAPPPPAARTIAPPPFEYQKDLNSYAQLKTKVLPSAEEKSARERLLKDARFLRATGDRLLKVPLLPIGEQDVAIDLLIEALQGGDQQAAEAAIAEIVGDNQVEDTKLPTDVREQLAGIKAEVIYHYTAYRPDEVGQVSNRLPGPVSRKILNNVTEAQKNNLAESQAEAR